MVLDLPTVTIVMSTYNGEKYIREQIDSLLSQEDVSVRINIRDDGSSDRTLSIIEDYKDRRIKAGVGNKNLGPAQSFLKLLRECEDSQYYAYCDQDDVWKPRKLIDAIDKLNKYEDEPALYISTYNIVDQDLNLLFIYDMKFDKPFSLQETIMYRAPSACTMVFNEPLRRVINRSNPEYVRMHDFWTLMVAEGFHYRIITDNEPQILYRQHGKSIVSVTPSMVTRLKRLINSFAYGNNERWRQANEFYKSYGHELPDDSLQILKKVVDYRDSFRNRICLMGDTSFHGDNIYHDILFKMSILMGKF